MKEILESQELINLVKSVFSVKKCDKKLAVLVDYPKTKVKDNPAWQLRRQMAQDWILILSKNLEALALEDVSLIGYEDVGSNNADLPQTAYLLNPEKKIDTAQELMNFPAVSFDSVFTDHQILMAPTEFSTTAPLKNAAKIFQFRAATMPGFSPAMIPALRIDYNEVSRRCGIIKDLIDPAHGAQVSFLVDENMQYDIFFDLRYRTSHLSSGRFPEPGVAGNLPSGETYIVPYEGERGVISQTNGILPVQFADSILLFTIRENKAIRIDGDGPSLSTEREHLDRVPAYGNMAELGFGVLGDFGLTAIDEILLDEKLGFHVAFGRSEHFGGQVSPAHFPSAADVIHLDRIYIPATQPRIMVSQLVFHYADNTQKIIIKDGQYCTF